MAIKVRTFNVGALCRSSAVVFATMLAACGVAKADVIYNLNFKNDAGTVSLGTGTLDLNLATLAAANNLSGSLHSILVNITTTSIDGHGGFTITPQNMVTNGGTGSDFISTGNVGQIFTLSAEETGTAPVLVLDLFTHNWQIHVGTNGATTESGQLIVTGPTLAAAPVPGPTVGAGASSFAFGVLLLGWFARRRRHQMV